MILLAKKRDAEENDHTGHVKQGKQILVRHSACLAHHIFFLQIRGLRLALPPPPFLRVYHVNVVRIKCYKRMVQ